MTEAATRARGVLWDQLDVLRWCDAEERTWAEAELDGMLLAAERLEALSPAEAARWQALADDDVTPAAYANDRAVHAHLEELLAALSPEDDATRFDGALDTLRECGILSEREAREWHARSLRARAPWLDEEAVAQLADQYPDAVFVLSRPPATPEEAAAADRHREAVDHLQRTGAVVRVLTATALSAASGLTVAAAVARTESLELVFHVVPAPEWPAPSSPAVVPPALVDDLGHVHQPIVDWPVELHAASGGATGTWRYDPPLAPEATALVAERDGVRWTLR